MTQPLDLLAWLDSALAATRVAAAVAIDRAEALAELRSLALERAGELGRPTVTLDDLQAGFDEETRARFTALARRVTTDEEIPPVLPDSDYRTPPPDLVEDKKVAAALLEYQRLIGKRDEEYGKLRALEDDRARAVEEDTQALADSIRADKDDPGQEATRRADAQILACRRRAEALAIAVTDAGKDLVATVDGRRASWAAKLETRAAERRAELAAAVEALATARDHLAEVLALSDWLRDFPGRTRWPVGRFGHVPGLARQSGEPYAFDAVVAALRELAAPPSKAPPEVRPLAAVPEAS